MSNGLMSTADVQRQLETQMGQGASFADRLRDERIAYTQNAQRLATEFGRQDPYTGEAGTPLQPSRVSATNRALLENIGSIASQYSPEQELAARQQDANLLMQIGQLAMANQESTSVDELLSGLSGADSSVPLTTEQRREIEERIKFGRSIDADTSELEKLLGVDTTSKKKESTLLLIDRIDKVLRADTNSITGDVRLGGIPFINRSSVETTKGDIDTLKASLTKDARKELKGQGTITDKETDLLAESIANFNLKQGDKAFRDELKALRKRLSENLDPSEVPELQERVSVNPLQSLGNWLQGVQTNMPSSGLRMPTSGTPTIGRFEILGEE